MRPKAASERSATLNFEAGADMIVVKVRAGEVFFCVAVWGRGIFKRSGDTTTERKSVSSYVADQLTCRRTYKYTLMSNCGIESDCGGRRRMEVKGMEVRSDEGLNKIKN